MVSMHLVCGTREVYQEEQLNSWTWWLWQNFASVLRCSALNLGYGTRVLVLRLSFYAVFWI